MSSMEFWAIESKRPSPNNPRNLVNIVAVKGDYREEFFACDFGRHKDDDIWVLNWVTEQAEWRLKMRVFEDESRGEARIAEEGDPDGS